MAQGHQLLGEPREDQPRIADDRQQHLAQGLGLAGIESLGGRPVARQAEVAEPEEGEPPCPRRPPRDGGQALARHGRDPARPRPARSMAAFTSTALARSVSAVSAPMISAASAAMAERPGASALSSSMPAGRRRSTRSARAGRVAGFPLLPDRALLRLLLLMASHTKWANIQHVTRAVPPRRRMAGRASGPASRPGTRPPAPAGAAARGQLEPVRYEGYGPGGAAVLVECSRMTDDRTRRGPAPDLQRVWRPSGRRRLRELPVQSRRAHDLSAGHR